MMSSMPAGANRHVLVSENDEENLAKLVHLTRKDGHLSPLTTQSAGDIKLRRNLKHEHELLEWFGGKYAEERRFAQHKHRKYFKEIFKSIVASRLGFSDWSRSQQPIYDCISRCMICLRIMMRDSNYQRKFVELDGIKMLSEHLRVVAERYLSDGGDDYFYADVLRSICSMFQKLATAGENREVLISNDVHKYVVSLLNATDAFILQCTLHILINLCKNSDVARYVSGLHIVDSVVRIVQEYDDLSRVKAADLLRILSSDESVCEQLVMFDCLPTLLSVLHDGTQCILLWHIVWVLVFLCKNLQHAREIKMLGGIPLLLNLLRDDRAFTVERHEISSANMRSGRTPHVMPARTNGHDIQVQDESLFENILKLKSVCCTALSELGLGDQNTKTIVEGNGVYVIANLILPQDVPASCQQASLQLQQNAFRALRFLFSMERNRRLFKRLFPTDMFQVFIDIGHYNRDSMKYKPLVDIINSMGEDALDTVKENIEELNQNGTPRRFIGESYAVMDLLGSGAFGSVYKVKKTNDERPLALKEVSIFVGGKEPKTGKNKQKKRQLDEIVHELTIIKEQLRHPNIVRYYKTFQNNDKLYIEMELIEGASLQEHINSLKEKEEKKTENGGKLNPKGMEEVRIWRVIIQLCLALRYLHKEKNIVHRDLTPGNIMLGENDHVTITDFGLAKQKQDESKLYSVVGTLLYSCPEIIKSEPYGEKADVWALGCILYQMATLEPPFPSDNMLSLAKKIAEARFDPVPESGEYSTLINDTIAKCLTVEPEGRPDIVGVTSLIAAPMLKYTDVVTNLYHRCEKRLEKERQRTQKNYNEARRNMENYRSLFKASQESTNRNPSVSSINSFTQQDKVTPFKAAVSAPAMFAPPTPPTDHRFSSSTSTSPSSDVFSDSASSGFGSQENLPPDFKHPYPPRPNSGRVALAVRRQDLPCRALSFDMSEPTTGREALLSRVGTAARGRPGSASTAGTLTISPRKVREINDPVQTMLHQLHKIIYVDQLPPTTEVNFRRRMISRYKRALFSPQSTSVNLKNELKKLLSGSQDSVDACAMVDTSSLARQATAEAAAREITGDGVVPVNGTTHGEDGITYSQMYSMIERVLCESGYYDVTRPNKLNTDAFHLINRYGNG